MTLKLNQWKQRTVSVFHYKSSLNPLRSVELLEFYSRVSVCRIRLHDFKRAFFPLCNLYRIISKKILQMQSHKTISIGQKVKSLTLFSIQNIFQCFLKQSKNLLNILCRDYSDWFLYVGHFSIRFTSTALLSLQWCLSS